MSQKVKEERVCKNCGEKFIAKRSDMIFCKRKCNSYYNGLLWKKKNKEKIKLYSATYREKNNELIQARVRNYRLNLISRKIYIEKNREKINKRARERYAIKKQCPKFFLKRKINNQRYRENNWERIKGMNRAREKAKRIIKSNIKWLTKNKLKPNSNHVWRSGFSQKKTGDLYE